MPQNVSCCKCDKLKSSKLHKTTHEFKKATHAIFDCDGTLFESEEKYHEVLRGLCKKYGKDYTMRLQSECYGGTDNFICVKVCDELKIPIPEDQFEKELSDLMDAELPSSPEKPGVQRLLKHFTKHGIPCAVASNSNKNLLNIYAKKRPEIFKYMHHIVSVTEKEVKRGKPAPDIFLIAASRFDDPKPKPQQVLVFEDSLTGLQSGIAAGMQVILAPGPRVPLDKAKAATQIIPNLTHFKPELFGIPPFDDGIAPVP